MAHHPRRDDILAEVSGQGAAAAPFHGFQPVSWSSTKLILTRDYVIEDTKFFVSARHTTLRLERVESVSLITSGNPLLLALGLATLVVLIGIVFLILYFIFKYRFLVISGHGVSLFLCIKGKIEKYEEFAEEVLETIKRHKGSEGSSSGGSSSGGGLANRAFGGGSSERGSSSERGGSSERVASSEGKKTINVRCPECDSEYQVPSTSVGKRFRCQKCQAVVDVQG